MLTNYLCPKCGEKLVYEKHFYYDNDKVHMFYCKKCKWSSGRKDARGETKDSFAEFLGLYKHKIFRGLKMKIIPKCPKCGQITLKYEFESYYHNEKNHWFICKNCNWKSEVYDGRARDQEHLIYRLGLETVRVYNISEILEIAEKQSIKFRRLSWANNDWLVIYKDILVKIRDMSFQFINLIKDNDEYTLTLDDLKAEDWIYEEYEYKCKPKRYIKIIEQCDDCPEFNQNTKRCQMLNKEVNPNLIYEYCPLEDYDSTINKI